jgi:hydroxymethylpyrimidine pyrophosphatase-like HAD family hydrolase
LGRRLVPAPYQIAHLSDRAGEHKIGVRIDGGSDGAVLDEVELFAERASVASPRGFQLRLVNLLNDLDTLVGLLVGEVARESWLNAFLLAAGVNQIVEDHLHGDGLSLRRVERHVRRIAAGALGAAPAVGIRATDAVRWKARDNGWSDRGVLRWQRHIATIVNHLADLTIASAVERDGLDQSVQTLFAGLSDLPHSVRRSVVRLPSCFRNFDQQPADIARLTDQLSDLRPDRAKAIAVIGVRTSGSYTAPLHAAYLRALGYRDVSVLTFRPGQRWRRSERQLIKRVLRAGGLAVVTDDPPKSGGSILKTLRELERLGFPTAAIVPVIQVFDGAALTKPLRQYDPILLESGDWSVRERLEPHAVQQELAEMHTGSTVFSVERRHLLGDAARGHMRAAYRVELHDRATGRTWTEDIFVKGVGLGYFGQHALAVAGAVRQFVPEIIGLRDGLLYRRWLPESSRIGEVAPERVDLVAQAVVDYTMARAAGTKVDEDFSLRLVDRGAVWQRAGDAVAQSFGRWAQLARPLSHPLAKALLRVAEPSVIDGNMEMSQWFDTGKSGIRKVDFQEREFSSLDVYSFDHRFDLAGCEADLADAVRARHARLSTQSIDAETWLLYRLVHAAERHRDSVVESPDAERESAYEMQRYYAETVFADLSPTRDGPLCAVDVDWTLEAHGLGFPSITPAAAFALHGLARHGYRVVLATGRSLAEVKQRCEAYGLAGGVAEYGAAIYDQAGRIARVLLTADERDLLDRLRGALAKTPEVELDPAHKSAVRAYTFDAGGRRRALTSETITTAIRKAGLEGSVRAIQGSLQTDFMVNTIDKGVGLRALAGRLEPSAGSADPRFLALAVGDSAEDLPFMRLARVAVAPARSELASGSAGVRILHDSGPRSLRAAAAILLGHPPGACHICRVNHLSTRSGLLLGLLAAQDARGLGKLTHALGVAARLRSFQP